MMIANVPFPPYQPSPYDYPVCCAALTVLRTFGWYCGTCARYHPFRDAQGRGFDPTRRDVQHRQRAKR